MSAGSKLKSPTQYVATLTKYDALGRVSEVSNPFRPLAQPAATPEWTATEYDAPGRVSVVTHTDGAKVYTYDRYGNRRHGAAQTTSPKLTAPNQTALPAVANPSVQPLTNRIADDQDGDGQKEYTYDAAGNVTCDAEHCVPALTPTPYYAYDGESKMVSVGGGAQAGGARRDYLPFGEAAQSGVGGRTTIQGYSQADGVRQGFTGYERDDESGLNYAQARYQSARTGRFTSVDPLMASAKAALPQTWNRYAYVLNNPLKFIDPTGLIWTKHKESGERMWFDEVGDIGENYQALTEGEHLYKATDGRHVQLDQKSKKWDYVDYVEVIIWDSTMTTEFAGFGNFVTGLGGHVSHNIDGQSWSWENGGWADPESIDSYIEHNVSHRSGTGYVLFGGRDWNRRAAEGIKHGYDDYGFNGPIFGPYHLLSNNCGESFCRIPPYG